MDYVLKHQNKDYYAEILSLMKKKGFKLTPIQKLKRLSMPFILNSEGIKAYGCFNRQAIEEVYMNKIDKNRNLGVDILHNCR